MDGQDEFIIRKSDSEKVELEDDNQDALEMTDGIARPDLSKTKRRTQ